MQRQKTILLYLLLAVSAILPPATGIQANDNMNAAVEQIFLHTDRDIYIAGERAYFMVYLGSRGKRDHIPSSIVYVLLRCTGNNIIYKGFVFLDNHHGYGSIYLPDTMSTGYYQLAAYTNMMRNPGESQFSGKELFIANRFDRDFQVLTSYFMTPEERQTENAPGRDAVTGKQPTEQNGVISIAEKTFGTREQIAIIINTELFREVPSYINISVIPGEALLNPGNSDAETINMKVPHATTNRYYNQFPPESMGIIISGRLTDMLDQTGVPEADLFITTPDSIINLHHTRTEKNGYFQVLLRDHVNMDEIYITLADPELLTNAAVDLFDKFIIDAPFIPSGRDHVPGLSDYLTKSQEIVTINRYFEASWHIESAGQQPRPFIPRALIYSSPARTVMPDDYLPLQNLQEITREIIPSWRIRQREGKAFSSLINIQTRQYFEGSPAIFLDGIHIGSTNALMDMGSDRIRKIDIHNYPWRYGQIEFRGIVSITSRDESYKTIGRLNALTVTELPAIIPESRFLPPVYTGEGNIPVIEPDFRQLLFWEPFFAVESTGERPVFTFFSGDLKGEYCIRIEGITPSGRLIREKEYFYIR